MNEQTAPRIYACSGAGSGACVGGGGRGMQRERVGDLRAALPCSCLPPAGGLHSGLPSHHFLLNHPSRKFASPHVYVVVANQRAANGSKINETRL